MTLTQKGESLIYAVVTAILAKTDEVLKKKYFLSQEGPLMQDMCWDCIEKNLDALLFVVSALDTEAELQSMVKDSKESLLQFICRFQATMRWYAESQLNTQRATHILLPKLPQILQRRLVVEHLMPLA